MSSLHRVGKVFVALANVDTPLERLFIEIQFLVLTQGKTELCLVFLERECRLHSIYEWRHIGTGLDFQILRGMQAKSTRSPLPVVGGLSLHSEFISDR